MNILHVGLGPLGRKIASDVYTRSFGRIVAAVDCDDAVAGKPLADFVPESKDQTPVLPSLDAVTNWSSIHAAVVTTSSDLARCADTFRALLGRGLPVVSTCEELVWPYLRHADLSDELDSLARTHGGRLLGTGVNPGFLMDTLPILATAVCRRVDAVRVERYQDASTRRIPFQQKIGAGLSQEQFAKKVSEGTLRHVGLGESLHLIADVLGFRITRWAESLEQVKADRPLTCELGPIARGHGAGVRQIARGWSADREVITLDFLAAIGHADPHDRVLITGDPPLDLALAGGVHGDTATIAITLNAIPSVGAAPPGLHTMASILPVACRRLGSSPAAPNAPV